MDQLERETCGAVEAESRFMQYPGAYKQLADSGKLIGLLNRAWCHIGCGRDIVWIENDVCVFWLRTRDLLSNLDWIRLCPFRLDRSGPAGRLLMKYEQTGGSRQAEWSIG
jgi:hypothetical protein